MLHRINPTNYMARNRYLSMALLTLVCCVMLLNQAFAQNKTFRMEVEQSVEPGKLNVDIYIQKISGDDFALAECNFSLFVNRDYLNLPASTIDFSKSGPWHVQTMPSHYDALSKGNGVDYVVLNINRKSTAPSLPQKVTANRTRIGRLVIPVTDHSGFTTTTWRVNPTAVMDWSERTLVDGTETIVQTTHTDIKGKGDYVNPAANFPLCYTPAPPQLASNTATVCPGQSFDLVSNYDGPHEWYRNGELVPNATEKDLTTTQPGSYTAISRFYSCRSEVSQVFDLAYANTDAPALAATGSTQICASSSVTLQSDKTGSHQWYLNGQLINGVTANELVANQAGQYTAISINGTCQSATSQPITVSIVDNIAPQLTASSQGILCANGTVTIASDFSGNHRWYQGNTLVQNTGNQLIVAQAGTYRAEPITDCNAQPVTIEVREAVLSTPAITAAATEICQGEQVQVSSNVSGVHAWFRNGQSISGAGNTLMATEPGTYTAVMMDGGCASTTSNSTFIAQRVVEAPEVSASRTINNGVVEICENENLLLASSAVGDHVWYQNGNVLVENQGELLVAQDGIYRAATKDGQCVSQQSAAITVQVTPQPVQPTVTVDGTLLTTTAQGNLQWYRDGILVDGATSNLLVATTSGVYTVTASNDCGAATSDPNTISLTNRSNAIAGVGFQVYPNPFVGKTGLYLTLDNASKVDIEVYNLLGARVATLQQGQLKAGTHTFDFGSETHAVSAGTYSIVVRVNDATLSHKVIELER